MDARGRPHIFLMLKEKRCQPRILWLAIKEKDLKLKGYFLKYKHSKSLSLRGPCKENY
jgi:hypothetical protein